MNDQLRQELIEALRPLVERSTENDLPKLDDDFPVVIKLHNLRRAASALAKLEQFAEEYPCPVCGNEERGQGGYLSCECPAPNSAQPTAEEAEKPVAWMYEREDGERTFEFNPNARWLIAAENAALERAALFIETHTSDYSTGKVIEASLPIPSTSNAYMANAIRALKAKAPE